MFQRIIAYAAIVVAPTVALGGELAGHKFLITSVRTGDTEVFVVDPDTGDATNLTRSPASEDRYPCWSPNGRRVAFTSNRDGPYSLYVMDADGGGNVKRLVNNTAVCYMPSWQKTARGERIVFGMHGDKPEMASISPDGSDLKMLGEGHDPTLSPDGTMICYTGHPPGGGVSVFVMDSDGNGKRQVVKEFSAVGATFPNWSPDGKRIVYSFPVGAALELFVIDQDGSNNRQLTRTGQVCTPAAWSPDGKWISFRRTDERYWGNKERMEKVYAEKPADKRPVWVIRPDGTDAHVVECLRFQCAIDGSRAAWKPAGPAPSAGADARYLNLRVYDVAPGKLEAVVARFRDHVGPIRARHGIETLGHWTETAGDGKQKFIYLIAGPGEASFRSSEKAFAEDPDFRAAYAASEKENGKTVDRIVNYVITSAEGAPAPGAADLRRPQAFELRIYDVAPGRLESLVTNYREVRFALFRKHALTPLGLWTSTAADGPQRLLVLLAGESAAAIQSAKAAYHADPDWRRNVDTVDQAAGDPPTTKVESHILTPLDLASSAAR